MLLVSGTRFGPYQIVSALGAGGMGEVYRAHDTKLDRDVAIKILPDAFIADPERVARFQREARTLGSLNHPNIAHIYGLDESGGVSALVMELVDGEDLSERIARGAIPIDEALPIARQIGEALEAAHEQGIIHRDLKPANIKVRPDGTLKVLDFGLAKAIEPAIGSSPHVSQSPTITTPAMMTGVGVILGTAAYMSPEQARGKTVDKRSDIWAFGCVLYEMLTGRRAFDGEDVSDTLAAVLRGEPDWARLPPQIPPPIRALAQRCLAKDQRQRIADASTIRFAIDEAATMAAPAPTNAPTWWRRQWVWRAAAVSLFIGVAALLTGALVFAPRPDPVRKEVYTFTVPPPADAVFARPGGGGNGVAVPMALSPDGRWLVFTAGERGEPPSLWVRPLDSATARRLPGTANAAMPFWSPDSQFIGFFTPGELRRIDVSGGPAQTVCPLPVGNSGLPLGGAWNEAGTILFAPPAGGLLRVHESGGAATPVSAGGTDDNARWPTFLPDGNHFLYLLRSREGQGRGVFVGALNSSEQTHLFDTDRRVQFVPPNRLLFVRQAVLMSQMFDPETRRLSGQAIPVVQEVAYSGVGYAAFSASNAGLLTWAPPGRPLRSMVWLDSAGAYRGSIATPGEFEAFDLSGDESKVVFFRRVDPTDGRTTVGVLDLVRGTESRIGFGGSPKLSPDGRTVAFTLDSSGPSQGLNTMPVSGDGSTVNLVGGVTAWPTDWSRDGRFILFFRNGDAGTQFDIWVYDLREKRTRALLQTPANEAQARFSPNQRLIAYVSDDTGRINVFLRPFDGPGDRVPVSSGGGQQPMWSVDGKRLFYLSTEGVLMSVDVRQEGPAVTVGVPRRLFEFRIPPLTSSASTTVFRHDYAVAGNGERFLVSQLEQAAEGQSLLVRINWTEGLTPRAPTH
jgi:Tol biopolymer transport system component